MADLYSIKLNSGLACFAAITQLYIEAYHGITHSMIAARLFGKSKLCLRSASLGIQIPVMHSYKVSVAHCSTGVRITEDSWAADELKAQGMKLEPAEPVTELIVLSDHLLLNPSEKVVKLVEEITSLNMVEVKQFAARMAVCSSIY